MIFGSNDWRGSARWFPVVLLFWGLLVGSAYGQKTSGNKHGSAVMPAHLASVFKSYCYDCHDSASQEAGVDLEAIPFEISQNIETAERWSKVLNAINSGEMPPSDSDPIPDREKLEFLDVLSNQMVAARKLLSDSGGLITLRRLNRREYANTIEQLLGVRPRVDTLPDDQAGAEFDTSGASLFFSSNQLDLYLEIASKTISQLVNNRKPAKFRTKRVEPEKKYNTEYREYVNLLKKRRKDTTAYFAQAGKKNSKPPSAFDLLDEYQAKKFRQQSKDWLPQLEEYLARPESKTGAPLILTIKGGGMTRVKFPALPGSRHGKYVIRVRAGAYKDAPVRFQYLEFTSGLGSNTNHLGWRKVTGTVKKPQIIEFPIEHEFGQKLGYSVHQRTHQDRGDKNLWTKYQEENGLGTPPGVWVDWAEIVPVEGPRSKIAEIIFDRPKGYSEEKHAREILERFAIKAFRGTEPTEEYIDSLLAHYQNNRSKKQGFADALVQPLSIILASPSFLYMAEPATDGQRSRINDNELAVRLAYFLWSSPPDDELLRLAKQKKLASSAILRQQTTRMLADPRADRFIRSFTHQWLEMERIDMFQFNGMLFPTFDNAVRANGREELFQMVKLLLTKKMPLSELISADYAVLNDVMADFYELPEVDGHEFRQVKLPKKTIRGGLLGTAAIHCMGSDGVRSSPVERGAWVLRHLTNNPPPPAPPNVPQLSRLKGEDLTSKLLQKAHQEQPQCAQCHRKIDPIGYAMENFDAAGVWRDKFAFSVGKGKRKRVKYVNIDTHGELPSGEKFDEFNDLRKYVASHEDEFARGFTEALIAYGLGRPYGLTDDRLAEGILKICKGKDYALPEFIHAFVQSKALQTK